MGPARALRRWLGIAVAALAVAGPVGARPVGARPVEATAAPVRQTYLQFNMCGNACNHGGSAVVGNLERTIAADRPVAVTLNEVCENQYDQLRRDLPGYAGSFDATGPRCGNGTRYGNAVLVRGSGLEVLGSWQLPNPAGDETRRLLCVRGQPAGATALVVCVTHISFVAGNIAAQIDAVAGFVRGLPGGEAIVLGGDFNTDPGDARLNPVYSNRYDAGTGAFTEADSAASHSRMRMARGSAADGVNETTFARTKLDYIFLADGHWSTARATVVDAGGGLSDHGALLATATVTDG
jgi:endonuclease/exonuclease/phosphatase family metal-dependent hydrolase